MQQQNPIILPPPSLSVNNREVDRMPQTENFDYSPYISEDSEPLPNFTSNRIPSNTEEEAKETPSNSQAFGDIVHSLHSNPFNRSRDRKRDRKRKNKQQVNDRYSNSEPNQKNRKK